jgi:Ca2+-transporting ATPase
LLFFLTSNYDGDHADRPEGFGVGPNTLVHLLQARKYEDLHKLGGVKGVAKALNTNLEEGVEDSPEELQKRKDAYGDNTYPRKRPKGFLTFLWEACHDTTLIILMVAAVVSLAVSMPTDVGPLYTCCLTVSFLACCYFMEV